jgi:hypothetical protein
MRQPTAGSIQVSPMCSGTGGLPDFGPFFRPEYTASLTALAAGAI